jgi:hypothetical protein
MTLAGPATMRVVRLVLALTAVLPAGCAALVAKTGTDTTRFATREQVRAEFGPPDETGEEKDEPFDQFRTRRKIADSHHSASLGMSWAMTFGLADLVEFPRELILVGGRLWDGQDLRFEYDASGRVVRVLLDREEPEFPPNRQQ